MRSAIALVSALVVLTLVTLAIVAKEDQLAGGRLVYLELAPVDPRSLMQGDYMALRYRMQDDARAAIRKATGTKDPARPDADGLPTADGHIVAAVDGNFVASYRRLHDARPLAADEILLRYRVRSGHIRFATNAFFFEEGTARRYEAARYGAFRVAADGELLLTGLRDAQRRPL
ncbi:MAG: GDYXXLXY domain-containing protein [Burkholderiales bacterium]|nr:GDYXXLXY domain-containing protein [Burkholderiales bacterium]